ncbi:MAG: nucleoside deaminase [Candidatus Nanopelagicales bacterium]|jgi:tRNA(adenine34) deaminase
MRYADSDVAAMRTALELARESLLTEDDDVPVGALIIGPGGDVVASSANRREALTDPTAHAEVVVLRQAALALDDTHLVGCTLVVTLEPCPMCAGAAQLARVERVIFGAWNEEYGAAGSAWDLLRDRRLSHRPEVVGGVLADECGLLVREFFARRR